MAAPPSNGVFFYPDPSLFGTNAPPPPPQSPPHESTGFSGSLPPDAPVVAPPAPPFPLDPALLVLPGSAAVPVPATVVPVPAPTPAPVAGPVPAPSAGAPRLSVVGVMFPGFPAGLVSPMQITGEDAARYDRLVAGMIPLNLSQTLGNTG